MARTNNTLKNTGLIVAVVAAAFGIGYFVLGGPRPAPAPTDTLSVPATVSAPAAAPRVSAAPDPHILPRAKNSDYTAPNAPRIRIVEEKPSSMTLTRRPAVPDASADASSSASSADSEASQAAAPNETSSSTDTGSGSAAGTSSATGSDTPGSGNAPLIPPPAAPANTAGTQDQDFEQISGHGNAEAGQDGAAGGGKAQFRVQTGSFAAQQNARVLADALRSRGYTTSTRAEQEGGKTVYKVQIGAYRSRAAADKAAQDLQKSGYPAYSSPISP